MIPEKPRSVLLEAAFWSGQGSVLGIFRYYNKDGFNFERKQRYFIHSTVSLPAHSLFPTLNQF